MQERCEHTECSGYMHRPLTVNSMLIIYISSVCIYIYMCMHVGRERSRYVPFCMSSCLCLSLSISVRLMKV
jgi:hypothetical protein